jgi:ribosomal protein S11
LKPWVPAPNSFMVALPNRMAPSSFRTATQGASAVTDNLQQQPAQAAEQTSHHHGNRCHQQHCMTVYIKLNVQPPGKPKQAEQRVVLAATVELMKVTSYHQQARMHQQLHP